MEKRIVIIDANSIIHRAFHALPVLTTKKGEITNAVYGFLLVFFKAIKDFHPEYLAACFDLAAPTFRHKKYKVYKAKRPKAPDELYQQIPIIKEVLKSFNVPVFEKQGFEADDIIGTIADLSLKKQVIPPIENIIVSGDLDALQLINNQTKLFALRKGVKDVVLYDKDLVKEKFQGLLPEQILDYKALRGDASDNIPGVTGIGEKTAIELLLKFGTLDNLYRELEENSEKAKTVKPRLKEMLLKYKEQAFLSRDLAQIDRNVPINFNLKECAWENYDKERASSILKELEFYSLIEKLPNFEKRIKENMKLW
ncbi:MAG: hypothetical protein FJZ05_01060 [Candidatus Nealsonbacteria bacterium]|nr:hypothetical protein [Candidatus Nealsonbacteria bacterium]